MFEKVTIFGESAGSSSVNYQLLSSLSQGTFQRAIMQSGTVLGVSLLLPSFLVQVSWGSANTPEQAVSYGRELIQNLGCEVDTEVCLQNATVEAILKNTFLHGPDVDGIWQVAQMLSVELYLVLVRLLTILRFLRNLFCRELQKISWSQASSIQR